MSVYYVDSSALVKRYCRETGSLWVRHLADPEQGNGIFTAHITGGLNSTFSALTTHPFNPMEEFKDEYRCITADLRNASSGQSTGPLEIDRPWDAYADDHLGLMDHLKRKPESE